MCKPQLSLLNKFRLPFLQYIHKSSSLIHCLFMWGEGRDRERQREGGGRQGEKTGREVDWWKQKNRENLYLNLSEVYFSNEQKQEKLYIFHKGCKKTNE